MQRAQRDGELRVDGKVGEVGQAPSAAPPGSRVVLQHGPGQTEGEAELFVDGKIRVVGGFEDGR